MVTNRGLVTHALVLLVALSNLCNGFHIRLRIVINPNELFCVHQELNSELLLQNEVLVISPIRLTINYKVYSQIRLMISHDNEAGIWSKFHTSVEGAGTYKFCFDNSESPLQKNVFFALTTNMTFEEPTFIDHTKYTFTPKKDDLGAELNSKMMEVKRGLDQISGKLEKCMDAQSSYTEMERIDSQIAELTNTIVLVWSLLGVGTMVLVSLGQVFLIKSMFDNNSRMGEFLRKGRGALFKSD